MPFLRRQSTEGSSDRSERNLDARHSVRGNTTREEYELEEEIGRGNYGVVYRAKHIPTGMYHAVKIIDMDDVDSLEGLLAETAILHDSQCPQLPFYYGSFIVDSCLWVVMELLGEGSLRNLMEDTDSVMNPRTIAWIMKNLLHALCYLHGSGKLHRDIKAANIFCDSMGNVRLGDFGVSTQMTLSHNQCNTCIGSPYWMAPEVISGSGYNSKADIWSLGITVIELALGRPPLSDMHPMKALLKIPTLPPPALPEEGPHGSFGKKINSFVQCCLQTNPSDRSTAVDLLKHPFIKSAHQTSAFEDMLTSRHAAKALEGIFNPDTSATPSQPDCTEKVMRGWMRNTAELSSPSWDFTLDKRDQSSRKGISRSIFLEEK